MGKVLVTGGSGMLGRAIIRRLLTSNMTVCYPTHSEVNLKNKDQTYSFLEKEGFEKIFHCAALVGGIKANMQGQSIFLTENLAIDHNLLTCAAELNVQSLIYISSSCVYPANREEALKESDMLTGPLEPTNENYAVAKILGTKLTQAFREQKNLNWTTVVSSNLYGSFDNFDPFSSHLVASIILKMLEAKKKSLHSVEVWGNGNSRREFTFVDDIADWLVSTYLQEVKLPAMLNVGVGIDFSIEEFYKIAMNVLDVECSLRFDTTQPDGNSRKLMDSSLARSYGWKPQTDLATGIRLTTEWLQGRLLV